MKNLLETFLEEAFDNIELARDNVPREIRLPESKNMIKVAIGMRRTGKTHFLYQVIHQLLKEGISKQQILFINFEDDRLLPMNAKQMGNLLDEFYTLYPENHNRVCYFFLDEVHNVEGWDQVIIRYYNNKKVQLYLSGSSSKLLSAEIATSLRGRSLASEVWPYNFTEYLTAHQLALPKKPFGQKSFDIMRAHLLSYFETGGFPGVQNMNLDEWRDSLQGYVDTLILRDVVERHNITNIALIKYLAKTLLANAATIFSLNKFYNDIKSQGFSASKDTLHNYLGYLEEAYLIFTVPMYSESTRLKQTNPKKVYAIDNGLINAMTLKINDIQNKYLENQVFLDLRRQGKEIFYYKTADGNEVDFVTVDKEGQREIIQVTWDMSDPKTADRETRALKQAEQELGFSGKIITLRDYLSGYAE